jgi:salicylate hydroxylase
MLDAVTGEEVANIPCDARFEQRFGNPYAVAHRAHIHGPLLDACRAHPLIDLRTNSRVTGFAADGAGIVGTLASGERVRAAALIGADGVYSNVRQRIVGDGDPLPAGAIIFRATIPAADMPKELQHPYPTFWAGPGWHMIYYPISDWSMFNLGCTANRSTTGPWARPRCSAMPRIRWCSTSRKAPPWRWRMRSASATRRTNATATS